MVKIKLIYGTDWCGDCVRTKKLLDEHKVPYVWIDIDQDAEGRKIVTEINKGEAKVPTIIFEDGSFLIEPSNEELKKKLVL